MKNNELISVIVPAYNHENYIEECIDSIINQSYKNIELIILNDGSKDKTAEKIKLKSEECKIRFKRFVFIDKKNNDGVAKTLNKGCSIAEGKYLTICASDDSFVFNAFEIMYDFLENNQEYVLAVGDNYFIDAMSKRCYWKSYGEVTYKTEESEFKTFGDFLKKNRYEINFNSEEFGTYQSFLKGNYIPNGYLFRREVFVNRVKGYCEKPSVEDLFLHLQLSKYGKYKFIDKHLFNYRWHPKNTIRNRELMSKLNDITLDLEKEFEHLYQIEKLIFSLIKNSEEYKFLETNIRKITELYIRLLEKYPDKSEFYCYFRIFQEGKSFEEIENLIKNSEEYKSFYINKITNLYLKLLERQPDRQGLNHYRNLFQEGKSFEEIENLIKNSEEYKSLKINTKEITNLYLKLLERQPDRQGLNHYRNLLKEGVSIEEIENLIKSSEEYKSLKISTKEITNLYLKLLERQPDRQGLNDYRNLFQKGKSIEEIENLIKNSEEYRSLREKK